MVIFISVGQQRHKSVLFHDLSGGIPKQISANDVFFKLFLIIGDAKLQGQVKMKSHSTTSLDFMAHDLNFDLSCGCFNGTPMHKSAHVRIHCKPWNKPAL